MTNREQAIRDVADHLGIRVADLKIDLEYPGYYPRTVYAVAQRERVLELETELKQWRGCGRAQYDGNMSDPCDALGRLSLRSIELEAKLQQREGERG